MKEKEIYFYELSFFGDEDENGKDYNPEKACAFAIKTEIPPVISDKVALAILFGANPTEKEKNLMQNCTCVQEITADEASFFDVEGLTVRVEGEYGVFYKRAEEEGRKKGERTMAKDYDTLSKRMKEYEATSKNCLVLGTPKVIRLDMRAGHTFCKKTEQTF